MTEDAQLVKKPRPMPADDPRLGFHADANPIRSEQVPNDYGLDLIRRVSSAPSLYAPDLGALDRQTMPKPQTEKRQ